MSICGARSKKTGFGRVNPEPAEGEQQNWVGKMLRYDGLGASSVGMLWQICRFQYDTILYHTISICIYVYTIYIYIQICIIVSLKFAESSHA